MVSRPVPTGRLPAIGRPAAPTAMPMPMPSPMPVCESDELGVPVPVPAPMPIPSPTIDPMPMDQGRGRDRGSDDGACACGWARGVGAWRLRAVGATLGGWMDRPNVRPAGERGTPEPVPAPPVPLVLAPCIDEEGACDAVLGSMPLPVPVAAALAEDVDGDMKCWCCMCCWGWDEEPSVEGEKGSEAPPLLALLEP